MIVAMALAAVFQPLPVTLRLVLPPEIASEMGSYRDCKLQAMGAKVSGLNGKPIPKMVKKGGDCTAYRVKSVADADAVLTKLGKAYAERNAMITKAVQDIDAYATELKRLDPDA